MLDRMFKVGTFFKLCDSFWCPKVRTLMLPSIELSVTLWTVAVQAPLSMGFQRQEYWSGWPFPTPKYLSDPGTQPQSPALQVDSLPSEPPGKLFYKADTT